MIGKLVLSLEHCKSIFGEDTSRKCILSIDNHFGLGLCVFAKKSKNESFVVFNTLTGNSVESKALSFLKKDVKDYILANYNRILEYPFYGLKGMRMYILPSNFEEEYEVFVSNNKKLLAPVLNKYNGRGNMPIITYLYCICNGSAQHFKWAVTNFFKNGVSIFLLEKILNWYNKSPRLFTNLNKGSITSYNGFDEILSLSNEYRHNRTEKRLKNVINTFNTAQKRLLKDADLTNNDKAIINKFATLSLSKRLNFIQKMSTITSVDEILNHMMILTNGRFDWNRDSLMRYIAEAPNINCDVVYDKNNVVLVSVKSFDTAKFLARATNWCICKNKQYWNNYMARDGQTIQYILFDFNKKEDDDLSIIGFTVNPNKGITHSHSFSNKDLKDKEIQPTTLSSWVLSSNNISSILESLGIDEDVYMTSKTEDITWNKDYYLNILNRRFSEDYYTILDMDNKFVFDTNNIETIFSLFSFTQNENCSHFINSVQGVMDGRYIVFMDFNKPIKDPYKVVISCIVRNGYEDKTICNILSNGQILEESSIDTLLNEYNLPFDTICRVADKYTVFVSAFRSYNIPVLEELIQDKDIKDDLLSLRKNDGDSSASELFGVVCRSIQAYHSSSFLDLFYKNGLKLCDVFGHKSTADLAISIYYTIQDNIGRHRRIDFTSENIREKFQNGTLEDDKALVVGYFYVLMSILHTEENPMFFHLFAREISYEDVNKSLILSVVRLLCNKLDFTTGMDDGVFQVIQYLRRHCMINEMMAIKERGVCGDVARFIDEIAVSIKKTTVKSKFPF